MSVDASGGGGRLCRLVLTASQRSDAPHTPALLDGLLADHVLAEAAYDSDAIHQQIATRGGKACIRPNLTRKRQKRYDRRRYKHRNVIERFFRRIKQYRRVATCYEKKAANFTAFIWLAAGIAGCT